MLARSSSVSGSMSGVSIESGSVPAGGAGGGAATATASTTDSHLHSLEPPGDVTAAANTYELHAATKDT
ncbi:hypothetical protein HaLaN_11180, partial [Haematococcus lacustris]